jgi:ClpP class serine protease
VFTGQEAVEVGLADGVVGLQEALEAARRRAGIAADAPYRVQVYPRPAGWLAGLLGGGGRLAAPPAGAITDAVAEAARWQILVRDQPLAYEPARLRAR